MYQLTRFIATSWFISLALLSISGCASAPSPEAQQAKRVFEELQPGIAVEVSSSDYSRIRAIGLNNLNRALFVDGMVTGCADAGGEVRGMSRSSGWVCYLPEQGREAFAVIYSVDSLQLLMGGVANEGLLRKLLDYGYER